MSSPSTSSPRLARNFAFLSIGEIASKLFTFFAYTYLGRTLGPERYGDLEFSLSATLFFALFVQLGLGSYGAREIAKAPERAKALLSEILEVRLWTAALSVLLLAAFTLAIPKPLEVKLLLAAYGASLLVTPGLMLWFFQGHDDMHWVAAASLMRQASFAVAVFAFFREGSPLWWVGGFETLSIVAASALCWVLSRRMGFGAPRFGIRPKIAWTHLKTSAPIGLSNLAWAALWFFPVVILGLTLHDSSVGWFGAAHRATLALHTFVWWYFFNLLPSMARTVGRPREELAPLMTRSLEITSWASLAMALGFTLLAQQLLSLAYGADFAQGGPLLATLVWAIPVTALSGHYRYLLLAYDFQGLLFAWTTVGAVVACAITWALAGQLGALAGAAGLVAGNVVLLLLSWWSSDEKIAKIGWIKPTATPAAAFLVSLAPLLLEINRWIEGALAGVIYALLFCWIRRDLAGEVFSRVGRRLGLFGGVAQQT
ncbi:MAG: oligosaccharide flippase family protein [Acidobacteria bacterium]|nr:oligosaccharide flippase family protein [Acidobacteriota bacterium]